LDGVHENGIVFIEDAQTEVFVSFDQLLTSARNRLAILQEWGLQPGNELVFQLGDNRLLIELFWACLLGKIIPVPLQLAENRETEIKVINVFNSLNDPYLGTSGTFFESERFSALCVSEPLIRKRTIVLEGQAAFSATPIVYHPGPDEIAYIQFSSGSTGAPKGVVLTHENLVTNLKAIHDGIQAPTTGDLFLSWMPLTHDMGLIGFHLTPLVMGWTHYIMPSSLFSRNPGLWLTKIHEHHVTFTASPNFGYSFVMRHFRVQDSDGLDLSSVRVIVNGAEPISFDLCMEFSAAMGRFGLKEGVIFPVYGLAEASLAVAFSDVGRNVEAICADKALLSIGDKVKLINKCQRGLMLVNVGRPVTGVSVSIRDHKGKELDDGYVGIIKIKGKNVTSGYYNNVEATNKVIGPDGWLDTGDLGAIVNGRLYVTGRYKDIIFSNGLNYYPHDLERIAEQVVGIEPGKIVLAGCHDARSQREAVIAFVVYKDKVWENFFQVSTRCKRILFEQSGIEVHYILPVRSIPKTTSGKVQRFRLIERFQDGEFDALISEWHELKREPQTAADSPDKSGMQEKFIKACREVFAKDDIDPESSFFDYGLDSLRAGMLAQRLSEIAGMNLTISTLFTYPSIRLLEGFLLRSESPREVNKNRPADLVVGKSLSSVQTRLFFHWCLDESSLAYNIPVVLDIFGDLDVRRLEECFKTLIQEYEALRTSFQLENEQPVRKVSSHAEADIERSESAGDRFTIGASIRPFDLGRAPLCRMTCFRQGERKFRILFDFHHIIMDGIALNSLLKQLFQIYRGESPEFYQFGFNDLVNWEAEKRSAGGYFASREFWSSILKDLPVLQLRTDYPRPVLRNDKGARKTFTLDPSVYGEIAAFARDSRVTVPVLLLAAYKILLFNYTGQEDIAVGVPVSGRGQKRFHSVPGMFVNNVIVRSQPVSTKGFKDYLEEIKQGFLKVLDNQDYLFEDMLKDAGVERPPGRNALFDTMYIFQSMEVADLSGGDLVVKRLNFDAGISKYDLSLELIPEDRGLTYVIEYDINLFEEATIERMGIHYEMIVRSILGDPFAPIGKLEVISESETNELLSGVNQTERKYPLDETVPGLFTKIAKTFADKAAMVEAGIPITYRTLNENVDRLVETLQKYKVSKGDRVCICMDNSARLVTAILAVLKAGAIFVPIEQTFPMWRKQFICTDAEARLVIASRSSDKEDFSDHNVLAFDELSENGDIRPDAEIQTDDDALAYLLYTSGSTGKPKGVMIGHRQLINYTCWAIDYYRMNDTFVFPLFTSIGFDLTLTSIFVPLLSGGTIVIYAQVSFDRMLGLMIEDNLINSLKLTPSHLKLLRALDLKLSVPETRLRQIIVGGEALAQDLAHSISEKFGHRINVYNEYGPTETTIGCVCYKYRGECSRTEFVPIGLPIANTHVYVLDQDLRLAPRGVAGELFISGEGVGRGYWKRPDLSEEKFIANPFRKGGRLYKTGDIARWSNSMQLEFIGRKDGQVKLRGYRIELNEIEICIRKFPGIEDAVAATYDGDGKFDEKALYVFYVSSSGINVKEAEAYLSGLLPYYMLPSLWIKKEEIPLTSNGKVDYRTLMADRPAEQHQADEDPNELELAVERAVQQVLGLEKVRTSDDFYAIGGDSIKAVQISSVLKREGIALEPLQILTYRTVRGFSLYARRFGARPAYGIPVAGIKPRSPIEEWFFSAGHAAPEHYNQSFVLDFKRPVDAALVQKTFEHLVRFHDSLRINYDLREEKAFYNNDHLKVDVPFLFMDLSHLDEAGRQSAIAQAGLSLKNEFDLRSSLLVNVALIKCSREKFKLLATAHHLLIDGISWRIFLQDLYETYQAFEYGKVPDLPEKTATLTEWGRVLLEYGETIAAEADYWDRIGDVSSFPSVEEAAGFESDRQELSLVIDKENARRLESDLAKYYRTDPSTAVILAVYLSLREWTGRSEVVLELENHGRHLPGVDVSRTIGWFTAIFPAKFETKEEDLSGQLIEIKEQLRTIPSNGIGYGILKYLKRRLKGASENYSGVRINYLGSFGIEAGNDLFVYVNERYGEDISPKNVLTAKLEINAMIVNEELRLSLAYSARCFTKDTMEEFRLNLVKHLKAIIETIAEHEEIILSPSDFTARLDAIDLKELFH
jgi:amino acid adenylation domain-containing protein/non-ribosomal peptide synthase protein (TIGR01720 family)